MVRYLDAIAEKYGIFSSILSSDQIISVASTNPDDAWFFGVERMTVPYEIDTDYDPSSSRTASLRQLPGAGRRHRHWTHHRFGAAIDQSGQVTIRLAGPSATTTRSGDSIETVPDIGAIAGQILATHEGEFDYPRDIGRYLPDTRFIPELAGMWCWDSPRPRLGGPR